MKKMFFLSFLLIPATTHCMEEKLNLSKATPIERQDLIRTHYSNVENIIFPYFQENHHLIDQKQQEFKKINSHGYSALGFAAVAIKVYSSHRVLSINNEPSIIFDGVSYAEKKDFIQKLRQYGFEPTEKDRELALQIELEAEIKRDDGKSDLLD
jgi:hypothetical protein